jgi:hypothetical protein
MPVVATCFWPHLSGKLQTVDRQQTTTSVIGKQITVKIDGSVVTSISRGSGRNGFAFCSKCPERINCRVVTDREAVFVQKESSAGTEKSA